MSAHYAIWAYKYMMSDLKRGAGMFAIMMCREMAYQLKVPM